MKNKLDWLKIGGFLCLGGGLLLDGIKSMIEEREQEKLIEETVDRRLNELANQVLEDKEKES